MRRLRSSLLGQATVHRVETPSAQVAEAFTGSLSPINSLSWTQTLDGAELPSSDMTGATNHTKSPLSGQTQAGQTETQLAKALEAEKLSTEKSKKAT